jgi:hypothetical protein
MIVIVITIAVLAKIKAYVTYPTLKYMHDRAIEIVHMPMAVRSTRLFVSWFL